MAFDEIKKLAEALDAEIGRLDEDVFSSSREHEVTFDMAVAECEKESMHDRLNDLLARNEELEDRVLHQNFIIDLQKRLNDKLQAHIPAAAEVLLRDEIAGLNEVLETYVSRTAEIESLDSKQSVSSSTDTITRENVSSSFRRRGKTQLKLTVELGELQMTIAELKGALSVAISKHEDHLRIRSQLEQQKNAERLERIRAEKQRDAYARAYQDSLAHFKKIAAARKMQSAELCGAQTGSSVVNGGGGAERLRRSPEARKAAL